MTSDTYELRIMHCPCGCGHRITHRAQAAFSHLPCPRCGGANLGEFSDLTPFLTHEDGRLPPLWMETYLTA